VIPENASSSPLLQHDVGGERSRRPSSARNDKNDQSTAQDQLRAKGFLPKHWYGKCEADKVSMGTYAVSAGQGGMYGLVFDNTFSKTVSKTATFVLLTYPTNAPPHSTHHSLQNVPPVSSGTSLASLGKNQSPKLGATAADSVDSLHSHLAMGQTQSKSNSILDRAESESGTATSHTGILQKLRRKKGQGYARRFFSLDFGSSTLSYYYNRNSSALRGAIPLSLAAISADSRRREFTIDSGAEVWHLKAGNAKDFDLWATALDRASSIARGIEPVEPVDVHKTPIPDRLRVRTTGMQHATSSPEEEREWEQVEALLSRIVGTRDAVRRLSKDTAPGSDRRKSYAGLGLSALGLSSPNISSPDPNAADSGDYFGALQEKRPFWKRKASTPTTPQLFQRSISTQLAVPTPERAGVTTTVTANGSPSSRKNKEENSMHEHCIALLNDLDNVLHDFQTLLANSKRRRQPTPRSAAADRASMDSTSTGEFYDAQDDPDHSQIMIVDRGSEEENPPSEVEVEVDDGLEDDSSISSDDQENPAPLINGAASLFPSKPKSLEVVSNAPAPKRRRTIPKAEVMPPSLIGILRKYVGKDLSTISMPVSANEPTSLLQRVAEQLEYANLLDTAARHKQYTNRLLNVAAFAVSQFSSGRVKERAIRKPFNPMLGETFELVRSEKEVPGGFRLLVEKVSHRPVVIAMQADAQNWSFSQTPAPTQKFWGKSAELITDGRGRVVLRLLDGTDEFYSWNVATVFLRNVVVGEKYVEPVGTMTILNETTGAKATVEFKQKGMFGGRSEEVQIDSYGPDGVHSGIGLTGTWTQSLRLFESGKADGAEIWRAGELVENAAQRYGLTTFAASLNEITEIEAGKLPPTDCRLRPDQRAAENQDLDEAEILKAKLEDNQRTRRKDMEERGETYKPRWFVRVDSGTGDGEECWRLKGGKEGYWEERVKGKWDGIEDILAA
jgi:hypothetical protein